MTEKCYNHTPQINQRHREEEIQNTVDHTTARRQLK